MCTTGNDTCSCQVAGADYALSLSVKLLPGSTPCHIDGYACSAVPRPVGVTEIAQCHRVNERVGINNLVGEFTRVDERYREYPLSGDPLAGCDTIAASGHAEEYGRCWDYVEHLSRKLRKEELRKEELRKEELRKENLRKDKLRKEKDDGEEHDEEEDDEEKHDKENDGKKKKWQDDSEAQTRGTHRRHMRRRNRILRLSRRNGDELPIC